MNESLSFVFVVGGVVDVTYLELMLLGFISLLLTVFQSVVASICMPEKLGRTMLPCKYEPSSQEEAASAAIMGNETTHARRLFQAAEPPAVALQQ
jgi:hypothetical protein